MKRRHLHFEQLLPRSIDLVFPFFADPSNLEVITPDWLQFAILDPRPEQMASGVRIHYKLRVRGFPIRWESEITSWDPPYRFVDELRRGPYRLWIHEHRFESVPEGTRVLDSLRYAVWGGGLVDALFVRRDIERIFEFRRRKLIDLFRAR